MAMCRRKEDGGKIPKCYIPVVLIGDEEDGEERVMVLVRILKEPCMEALLEIAAQQFGYRQQGVLSIPYATQRFEQIINMACKAK